MIGNEGKNLVFLMSMPRAGSTILSMALSAHPKISCPPEPWLLLFVAEIFNLAGVRSAPYGRSNAQMAALDFLFRMEYERPGALTELVFKVCRTNPESKNQDSIASNFVRDAFSAQLALDKKIIFVDKTPRNYTILPWIDRYFPLSKKIFLNRNPLDIANSYLTTWQIPITELIGKNLSVNTRDFAEGLFSLADYFSEPDPLKYVLAYEDLVLDSASRLQDICRFIGVRYQPSMLEFHGNQTVVRKFSNSAFGDPVASTSPKAINSNSVGAGVANLDKSELQSLLDFLGGDIFYRLGYGDVVAGLDHIGVSVPDERAALSQRGDVMDRLRSGVIVQNDQKNLLGLQFQSLTGSLGESEADRVSRLEQIESLTGMLRESEADRAARAGQIDELTKLLRESEADRASRLEQIESLTAMLRESEADRAARLERIHELTKLLTESAADRAGRAD